jgi:predicted nucleotidyltransferase
MRKRLAEKLIRRMARRIARQFAPERIILFGSHGRGDAGPNSDVDLLIVMPVAGSRREKAVEIGVALDGIRLPKDIIVTTPEDFEWRKQIAGTIERPAAREGKMLYALGEARQAVALARRIRGAVRRQLPKEALRRRSR